MPNPITIALVGNHLADLAELPKQLPDYYWVQLDTEQAIQETSLPQNILLYLNGDAKLGPGIIKTLRNKCPRSSILVLSQDPSASEIINAYESGADACLLLPLDEASLQAKLKTRSSKWRQIWSWIKPRKSKASPAKIWPHQNTITTVDLSISFFGNLVVRDHQHQVIDLKGQRMQALFACLLHHREKGLRPDQLMNYLWPEVNYQSARNSLNVALSQLRQILAPHLAADQTSIELVDNTYRLAPNLRVYSDVDQFQLLWEQGSHYASLEDEKGEAEAYRLALENYQSDYLENLHQFEWTTTIRDNLWDRQIYMLEKMCHYYYKDKQYLAAIQTSKQLLNQEPCLEKVHQVLMLSYLKLGQRHRALKQFQICCKVLKEELSAKSSNETNRIYKLIIES